MKTLQDMILCGSSCSGMLIILIDSSAISSSLQMSIPYSPSSMRGFEVSVKCVVTYHMSDMIVP